MHIIHALYKNDNLTHVQIKKETPAKMYTRFKADLINDMDHMCILGTEPSSVILSQRE